MPISQCTLLSSVKKLQRKPKHPNSVVPFTDSNSAATIADAHEVAYWYQWRIAIHEVCIRFEANTHIEVEGWSRERLDQIVISTQTSLKAEIQHLESQLGKFASLNAKLEGALSEKVNGLTKSEMARAAAVTATCKLQVRKSVVTHANLPPLLTISKYVQYNDQYSYVRTTWTKSFTEQ